LKTCAVNFSPESVEQLLNLYSYLAKQAGQEIAQGYVDAILDYCESLKHFPMRGVPRDDIREGLRVTHYQGRTTIAYAVINLKVSIIGVFYGGQDYEKKLNQ
jgi:plasmid stabilization system protein ParE